jgi:hypothetical protein
VLFEVDLLILNRLNAISGSKNGKIISLILSGPLGASPGEQGKKVVALASV